MTDDAKRRWVERRCYGVRWQVLVPVLLLSVAAALFCIGYFTRPGVTRKAAAPAAVNANAVQPVPSCIAAVNSSLVKDVCSQRYPRLPMKWRSSRSKVLALTFDDGPWAVGLTKVLDVLAAHSIKSAFFMNTDVGSPAMGAPMGSYVAPQNMAAMRRIVAEGHELGSHAALHKYLPGNSSADLALLLDWAVANISQVTGLQSVPMFRAPYGAGYQCDTETQPPYDNTAGVWDGVRQRHIHIGWSFDAADWTMGTWANCSDASFAAYGPPLVAASISGVVLMHASPLGFGNCPQALHRVIGFWKANGYTFDTVSSMVQEIYDMPPRAVVGAFQECLAGKQQQQQHQPQEDYQQQQA